MTNLINKPKEVVFRQTLNVTWKRWETPKRLTEITETNTETGKVVNKQGWRVIDDPERLITKKDGIAMALWRLQGIMDKVQDEEKRLIWETVMSNRERVTVRGNTYSVWTLTCKRIKRDMSGVM
ncbi:hypothetical protein LCGC14_1889000 [marine sediment metagenome]|uniref:Uncharacterized protein n=1 Tax=marine sediment metagenome TaxID=412755 RepID=A0A0F9G087_9ZZZZ